MLDFQFNLSTDGGSSYNCNKNFYFFQALSFMNHDSEAGQAYHGSIDLAQSTSYQIFIRQLE
jgi:hypothetical protein